jgi:2-oxo-3-hexenedioate decarboxylase
VPVGRKIGFTHNLGRIQRIWTGLGYVYNRTIHNLAEIAEPRIEPEIVFKLALAPARDMDETALLAYQ